MAKEEKNISSLKIISDEAPAGPVLSRRRFLQVLGAASAAGVAGCADKASQNIFPNLKGNDQQVPGIAVWYSSTCTECSAGCGIKVRTREGRAVKIEGNVDHLVNQGGLCALGQASLQSLYDPDRIRQPLKKSGASFEPISWDEAYAQLATWVKDGKKKAILTSEISGALQELVSDFGKNFGVDQVVWDSMQPTALASACEAAFGKYGVPQYKIENADTLVNFGADFLETWVSPCEYARGWSKARKRSKPIRVVHIEPRLSLTGANADLWLAANPGTEALVASALLKLLIEKGRGSEYKASLQNILSKVNVDVICDESGLALDKLTLVAEYLYQSESSLILAGGTVAGADNAYELSVLCNLLNLVLGNVGKTVNLSKMREVKTSLPKIKGLIDNLNSGTVDLLLVYDTNPAFSLPAAYNLKYAIKKAAHIVSFSSHLDETTQLADLILPSNTGLESWGDHRAVDGVLSLQQPAMTPVFDTREFGDSLLLVSDKAGKSLYSASGKDFKSYLKDSWKKLQPGITDDVWRQNLERGGAFSNGREDIPARVASKAYDIKIQAASFVNKEKAEDVVVYPYASVKSFDGRAANRPWLQELPDPITQISWDSWAEINPRTAKEKGLEQGDMLTARNYFGELNLPVYITPYVKEGIIAVPLGQGHSGYGRYAKKVGGGNVLDVISVSKDSSNQNINLFSTKVEVFKGRGKSTAVNVQGSDSQQGRELAQTSLITAGSFEADTHSENGQEEVEHHSHHEPKQMYEQRGHPLYQWGLTVDLASCTGCSACVVACYAENNIPVVGKTRMSEGREMSWLRIERYYEGEAEELKVNFLPMMCQHCGNAPCEPVCPVYATYHNEEGLNAMIYNRCVGTRYCSNNCSYKVRRFNWFEYEFPEPLEMQLNPDVMKRVVGVMEKCTFCIQRISEAKDMAKDMGRAVKDGEIQPACVQSCPTRALTFGNLNDKESQVSKLAKDERAYKVLDHHINTQPSVSYLKDIRYKI
jgi:anaerobic selenocysteine-containing dehydrogenase/Fe-S-cluster-containing dehydrogenase component